MAIREGELILAIPEMDELNREHQPLAGHAICNIGDALTIFSGQILRSNMHRVL